MVSKTVDTGAYGRWQIVIDLVSQNVAANTSYLRVRGIIYNDSPYESHNNGAVTKSVSGSGSWSGSGPFSVAGGSSTTFISTYFTLSHNSSGNLTVSFTANMGATGTSNIGGPTSVTYSGYVLPQIVQVPAAPTAVVATRTSDTAIGLVWTRNSTTAAPYTGQSLYVSIDGAASKLVANVSSTATTYAYVASANHKYTFTVAASNSAGSKTSAASNIILTTPDPLASLAAAVVVSGTIRLTIPKRPTVYTEAQVVITESHNGGTTWNAKTTLPMSSLSTTAAITWDDTAASTSGVVQYRAVVQTTAGTQGVLSSPFTMSNTITLNTPPLAPTNLTPSGAVDASRPIRLAWMHTPSSDGANQSSRKIDYSIDGGTNWVNIVTGNTSIQYYDWTPTLASFTAGQTILFRVATAGSQVGVYGAYSASQTLTLYGSLAVTFVAGSPPATHGGGPIPVAWNISPTYGTATQTRYQVVMTDQATGLAVYDTGLVASDEQATQIPAAVQQDQHTYVVQVTVLDNHQLASLPVTVLVVTNYLEPGPVHATWSFDDETGTLVFYPAFTDLSSAATDDTNKWTLERSLDGGVNWLPVGTATGAVPIGDPLARLNADSMYRTVGFTALGVAGDPFILNVPATDVQSKWAWLNYGDDYQSRVRFGWSQTVDITSGRASESYELEGVDYPAAVFGQPLNEKYAIAGKLLSGGGMPATLQSSTADDMIAASKEAAVCVFRGGRGAWFTARLTDMRVSPLRVMTPPYPDEAGVAFTVEHITA